MHAILSVDRGDEVGRSIVIEAGRPYIVQRSREADFSIRGTDSHMSKSHFRVEVVPQGLLFTDLGSENGPFAIARVIKLAGQLLEALDYAHVKGFVHRDIKPGNLLLTVEGGHERVKLADFGLARVLAPGGEAGYSHKSGLAGTPAFLAPEQILDVRRSLPATDQYAVAATLYNLLTGRHTHDFETDILCSIIEKPHVSVRSRRPEVPDGLAAIIDRGLQKDPTARDRSIVETRRALARLSHRG